jgi:hypothetical protein
MNTDSVFSRIVREAAPFWVEKIKEMFSLNVPYCLGIQALFDGFCSSVPREATPFWVENIKEMFLLKCARLFMNIGSV